MKRRTFTEEERTAIINDYTSGNMTFKDIIAKYHMTSNTLNVFLDENHVPRKRKQNITKKCGHCGAKVELRNAKFCPFCGHNIMTESEQLIEELRDKISLLELLPSTERDDFRNVLLKAINYIKEKCRDTK